MRFSCRYDYHPAPCDPQQFICPVTVDVLFSDDLGHEQLVARLSIDYLDIVRAEAGGEDVLHICDADSAGWEEVYSALFEPGDDFVELRRDFDFQEPIFGVLFLYRSLFHHSIEMWRSFIIDHAANLFGESTCLVMPNRQIDVPDSELATLGFRRIADHDLLFRPNMLVTNYDRVKDSEGVLNFEVNRNVGEDFLQAWSNKYDPSL